MRTCSVTPTDITKKWVIVDAANKPLGRIASEVASVLRGKNKPNFVPHLDCGDNVVIINAKDVALTGKKWDQKFYYSHTSYIGGLKAILAKDLLAKSPEKLFTHAVKGMLPKNKLGRQMLRNLRVYPEAKHPHEAQNPTVLGPRISKGE
jgi:large subunit ribosomal protein L13